MAHFGATHFFVSTLLGFALSVSPADVGYEKWWEDSTEEVDWDCWAQSKLPDWLNGSFILPSVAKFSMGGLNFQGVLDGYGKLHRFQLADGKICLRARMLRTKFYNESMKTGTVPPAMLFKETEPPRKNCHLPLCNILGANDNTFVNTILIGEEYSTWTDSTTANTLDPYTLSTEGAYKWTDDYAQKLHPGHIGALSSAHPLRRKQGKGDWVSLQINPELVPNVGLGAYVDVMTISDADPHKRKLLTSSRKLPAAPYFHSYGVTDDYVVLPYTPLAFSLIPGMLNKPMIDAFSQTKPMATTFRAYPFAGGEPLEFQAPRAFTFNHVVNSFNNESAIVFDVIAFPEGRLWIVDGPALLPTQLNKTLRDAYRPQAQTTWRYVMHLAGPLKGTVTSEQLSTKGRATDFPKINMKYSGREYCVFYAQEWFHNDQDFGSMAILKQDICTGEKKYWYNASTYPSEPFFIGRPGAEDEDDGVVVFSSTHGPSGTSSFIVADAKTMETSVEQPMPVRVTFTTHGEWFDGLVGDAKPENHEDVIGQMRTFVV